MSILRRLLLMLLSQRKPALAGIFALQLCVFLFPARLVGIKERLAGLVLVLVVVVLNALQACRVFSFAVRLEFGRELRLLVVGGSRSCSSRSSSSGQIRVVRRRRHPFWMIGAVIY
jgi:hypothetical protein